ncbi:MAG: aldehyde dehydrogenase family protein [SAR202 cluster bacterium]|nr:aldehyde dehydrogenase family protein [SAR202 cluster bacterium]
MAIAGKNYINGQWTPASSEETFPSASPADTRDVLGHFPRSNSADVDAAVKAAREAFPVWRRESRIRRGEVLDRFVQIVKAEQEDIARIMSRECGKSITESRADVVEGIHTAQYWFGVARNPSGDVIASEIPDKDSYVYRKPKGVVACISPWNFPFAIPLWLTCPSLVEGNTVVLKPAEETPLVAQRLVECMEKAGAPRGVFNLVQGMGEEAGWPLVNHPEVDVVLFTGSAQVGSMIKEACAKDYRKFCVAEMGGKNAIVVFDDADFDLAVDAAMISAYRTTGQRCVSAGRAIVHESIVDRFADALKKKTQLIRIGNPLQEDVFMGPLVSQAALKKVEGYNKLAVQEGANVLLNGGRLSGDKYDHGYFIRPFLYTMKHNATSRVLREEVFGPHLAIIPFKTLEEAAEIYNDTEYGFSMALCTNDYRKVRAMRELCDFGVGYVNLPTIGAEVHLPFGGVKRSGTGIPSAAGLLDAVSHRVTVTVNHDRKITMAQGMRNNFDELKPG